MKHPTPPGPKVPMRSIHVQLPLEILRDLDFATTQYNTDEHNWPKRTRVDTLRVVLAEQMRDTRMHRLHAEAAQEDRQQKQQAARERRGEGEERPARKRPARRSRTRATGR